MSTAPLDPATQRLLAGELAKSLWATAKPQAGGEDGEASGISSGADTFANLFTDVLADAIAVDSQTSTKASARR
jgi:hypothetical protein